MNHRGPGDPLTHRVVDPDVRELALKLFDAFWAAIDRNASDHRAPKTAYLLRDPDCEAPPRLWVYMAEMLRAVEELPGYEVLGRDERRWRSDW